MISAKVDFLQLLVVKATVGRLAVSKQPIYHILAAHIRHHIQWSASSCHVVAMNGFSLCLLVLCFGLADDRLALPSNLLSSVLISCRTIAGYLPAVWPI